MDTIKRGLILLSLILTTMTISSGEAGAPVLREKPIKYKSLAVKMRILQPNLKQDTAEVYEYLVKKYCNKNTHDVMVAILYGESSLNSLAESSSGDFGLGQVNYYTWGKQFNVTEDELLNPITNIKYSCKILGLVKKSRPHDANYWGYYHHSKKSFRELYIKRINAILQKIKD